MEIDDDDDLYGPEDGDATETKAAPAGAGSDVQQPSQTSRDDDLEEGEEEDEGEDMDEDDSVRSIVACPRWTLILTSATVSRTLTSSLSEKMVPWQLRQRMFRCRWWPISTPNPCL